MYLHDKLKFAKVIPLFKSGERTHIVISTLHLYVNLYCEYIFCIRSVMYLHDKLKIAKVIPLFKSGERKISNYGPVSILPIFSKILEKGVHCRIINYLDVNKIL
jgi:hypothetical protein